MKEVYHISGMTCNGCVASVKEKLIEIKDVQEVEIDLVKNEAEITMISHLPIGKLKAALPDKYNIQEKASDSSEINETEESKLQQLKPLLLIFAYLFAAGFLLNYKDWNIKEAMLDFMGLFCIVFSFLNF